MGKKGGKWEKLEGNGRKMGKEYGIASEGIDSSPHPADFPYICTILFALSRVCTALAATCCRQMNKICLLGAEHAYRPL